MLESRGRLSSCRFNDRIVKGDLFERTQTFSLYKFNKRFLELASLQSLTLFALLDYLYSRQDLNCCFFYSYFLCVRVVLSVVLGICQEDSVPTSVCLINS